MYYSIGKNAQTKKNPIENILNFSKRKPNLIETNDGKQAVKFLYHLPKQLLQK